MVLRLTLILAAVWTAVVSTQPAQLVQEARRPASALTLEDIYGREGWTRFNGSVNASMSWAPASGPWLDDNHYLWPDGDGNDTTWRRVDASTGSSEPAFNVRDVEDALLRATSLGRDEAARLARRSPVHFNPQHTGLLLTGASALYYYDIAKTSITRLTDAPGPTDEESFSPSGQFVVFARDNNLYLTDVTAPRERALTTDGSAKIYDGVLDWVYSEELYGRGNHRGYWWSPDSARIAFVQLDDTNVPEYTLLDDVPREPRLLTSIYPKAGDPNPRAAVFAIDVKDMLGRSNGEEPRRTRIDTSGYGADFLVSNVGWSPDSRSVVYQVQDRRQSWLELNAADPASGAARLLFKEAGRPWVERWADSSADVVWLNDGSFLWLSERSGWRHLYHYRADGSLIRQVTRGDWEVRDTHGVDASGEWVYFSATERTPIGLDVYRVRLNGGGMQRLSSAPGDHTPFFNSSRSLYLDVRSDVTTPPQVRLHDAGGDSPGRMVRVVDANPVTASLHDRSSRPELLQVKTRDGFPMEAMMIKPPDFDPARRYPVYQFTYSGPHAQQVENKWSFGEYAYHQLLARNGVIVWICDNRTASGKGAESVWPLHGRLGTLELQDIEDGVAWLKRQPYVDGTRIGISGASYGGFITLYALTHSRSFTMGIAQGSVSDWRNYDSIYTERYLGLPADNQEGYLRSSPRFEAASLTGDLLLIHGNLDDNVHPQNTMQFAYELQKAGKPFQMMMYPKSSHGIQDWQLAMHLREMMLEFTLKHLGGPVDK